MYLLDTNVVSELRRPDKANAAVRDWAAGVPATHFHLSAITILEIEQGVLLMERRDAAQGAQLRAWLDGQVLPRFEDRILAVDTAVARACAPLHVPDPRSERDALIAATALVHGLTVVTRNVADFRGSVERIIDPWVERVAPA